MTYGIIENSSIFDNYSLIINALLPVFRKSIHVNCISYNDLRRAF